MWCDGVMIIIFLGNKKKKSRTAHTVKVREAERHKHTHKVSMIERVVLLAFRIFFLLPLFLLLFILFLVAMVMMIGTRSESSFFGSDAACVWTPLS